MVQQPAEAWASGLVQIRRRDELYLSYPLMRAGRGSGGDLMQQPSRFLTEIPRALVNEWNLRPYA